jgi:hypothetical protein
VAEPSTSQPRADETFNLKAIVAAVLVLTIFGMGVLVSAKLGKPSLQLSFVCATNDPLTGISWGVFRVDNRTTDYMSIVFGEFRTRKGFRWVNVAGGYDPRPETAIINATLLAPGFITFKTKLPPGESSFRLIMDVVPCTSIVGLAIPLPAPHSVRFEIGNLLLKWDMLPSLSPRLHMFLLSTAHRLESKTFRAIPVNQALQQSGAVRQSK